MKFSLIISCLLLLHSNFSQQKVNDFSAVSVDYLTDSVQIETTVSFYSHTNRQLQTQDAVKFNIKVTNLGQQKIPNLMRVSNRSKYLKLLFNGVDSFNLSMSNGMEASDWPWSIEPGNDEEYTLSYILIPDSGILLESQPINITWQYMGVYSSTEMVDLINKKVY